jgi:hypothetical protein
VRYSFSTGQFTTDRDALAGYMLADVRFEPDGQVGYFTFTGGRITHADTSPQIVIFPSPLYAVKLITRDLATWPITTSGTGNVDLFTGVIDNTGHRLISNEGTITTQYVYGGSVISQSTQYLAVQPDNAPLPGTTTLSAKLVEESGWWRRFQVSFHHYRSTSNTQLVSGMPGMPPGATYTVQQEGSFDANGTCTVPGNDFVTWAENMRGMTPTDFQDKDTASGQPLLLEYAFGAGSGSWRLPIDFEPAMSRAVVHLTAQTRAPIQWEYSPNLAHGSWSIIPDAEIPAGSIGDRVISIPALPRGFVRALVKVPGGA